MRAIPWNATSLKHHTSIYCNVGFLKFVWKSQIQSKLLRSEMSKKKVIRCYVESIFSFQSHRWLHFKTIHVQNYIQFWNLDNDKYLQTILRNFRTSLSRLSPINHRVEAELWFVMSYQANIGYYTFTGKSWPEKSYSRL